VIELAGRQAGRFTVPAKYQVAYDEVVRRIRTGVYQPGEKLPPIRELAVDLKVGQSTLKSALVLLQRDGWTRGQQGDGVYVADEPPEQASSAD
jgi:DNA-binding GntR family transcriptional regulator